MMSEFQLYSKEFIKAESSSRISKNPEHVFDFIIHEPKNVEEAQLGTLFMLGKIENVPENKYKNFDFLLNLIISVIKREFYSDPQRSNLEAFESSLNKANLYLADFAEKGNVEWINNFHFVCGVFHKNTLHITRTGNLLIKLLRATTVNHIEKKFPDQKKRYPLNTFGNIASGAIINRDKIILGTENLLDIISLTHLKEFSKRNCDYIISRLEESAKNKADKSPLICLVFEAREAPEKEMVSQLPQVEYKKDLLKKKKNRFSKVKPIALKALFISRKILVLIFLLVYKLISLLIKLIKPLFGASVARIETRIQTKLIPKIRSVVIIFSNAFLFLRSRAKALYCQNRPAFFVLILLMLFILVLPYSATQKINYYVKLRNFNKLTAEIQEIQKKTNIALIYQDKEKAKGLIQRNQALLAELLKYSQKSPLKNNNQILSKIALLKGRYQSQEDSINNIIRIENLELILDFSKTGFIVNPVGITKIKNNLYFYELDSGILYKLDLSAEEKNPLTLIFISAKDELRKMISLADRQVILFGQSGKVYVYDGHINEHNTYSLNPAVPVEDIKDLGDFLSNFYVLDASQSNIVKYSLSLIKDNVIKGKNWSLESIKEPKVAQGLAIDGSIYILQKNGLIYKYFKGKKVEEIKISLTEPLAGENKLFTEIDFQNLYVSDFKNKRLIVLNKQGEVINQYINDEFINLKDFWVTKDEKEAYLLCGKKVFKLEF